jgi:hypothetical protein
MLRVLVLAAVAVGLMLAATAVFGFHPGELPAFDITTDPAGSMPY